MHFIIMRLVRLNIKAISCIIEKCVNSEYRTREYRTRLSVNTINLFSH